jgi:hypothetical protein
LSPPSITSSFFASISGRHAEFLRALLHRVIGDEIRDEIRALFLHQLRRSSSIRLPCSIVRTPFAHRARDRVGRVRVRLRVAAERFGLLDGGADLLERELPAVERIVGARDAPGDHDLDLIDALPHLLARRLAHRIGAVDDLEAKAHCIAAVAFAVLVIGAAARIRVSAGRTDRAPAMNILGPGRWPCATPSRSPQSAPPVSRTVVKPRSIIARIRLAARTVIIVSGIASR